MSAAAAHRPAPPAVGADELRHAMGHFATGVTVVSALGDDDRPVGTTANAVASLSLDPPLILVCFERASHTLAAIRVRGVFGVNVLAAHHAPLSDAFARRGANDVWETVPHGRAGSGAPRLHEAIAHLDCAVEERLPGGDHEIVIGRVLEAAANPDDDHRPLVFYRGAYASLAS